MTDPTPTPPPAARRARPRRRRLGAWWRSHPLSQDGSLVTEYGLIAVIGATLAGLAIKWASGGAIFDLFGAIMTKVKAVVGV